jgi:hypothetical protein
MSDKPQDQPTSEPEQPEQPERPERPEPPEAEQTHGPVKDVGEKTVGPDETDAS